ncbi:MAG TPA: MFS transporter [Candidatus Dormibacteraeota bacterium]
MRYPVFVAAALVSFAGDWLTTVAVGVLVFEITGSVAAPAIFVLVRTAPRLFGPVIGGVLADRFPPIRALTVTYLTQAMVAVGLLVAASHRSVLAIYVMVVISQLIGSSTRPMQQATLPELVTDDQIHRASAMFGTGLGAVVLVAPALGTALLRANGPELLIALDAATFVIAAGLLLTLGPSRAIRAAVVGPSWRSAAAGLAPMLDEPVLRTATGTFLAMAVLAGAVQGSIVVIAADRFGNADLSGILYAGLGVGGVLGGSLVSWRTPRSIGRDLIFAGGMLAMLPLAGLAATHSLWVAVLLMAASAFGSIALDAWGPAEVVHRVDRALLGRANAVLVLCDFLGILVGAGVAVVGVPTVGWPATVVGTAAVAITFAFVVAVTSNRRATSPAPVN